MSETQPKTKVAAGGNSEKPPTPVRASPEQPPPAPARDENHGRGGLYEIKNGQRVLVQRTKPQE